MHDTENNLRDNTPETFDQRDAIIASVPSYEEPYIKVPKIQDLSQKFNLFVMIGDGQSSVCILHLTLINLAPFASKTTHSKFHSISSILPGCFIPIRKGKK
ncbi:hypothetical protein TSUD_41340, partial [Trifolium subterraneum]